MAPSWSGTGTCKVEDKGTTGVGELLVLSPASLACLLARVFFSQFRIVIEAGLGFLILPPPLGEATRLGQGLGGGWVSN